MNRKQFFIALAGGFGVALAATDPWLKPKTNQIINGGKPASLRSFSLSGAMLLSILKGYKGSSIYGIPSDAKFVRSFETPGRPGRITVIFDNGDRDKIPTGAVIPSASAAFSFPSYDADLDV